MQKLSVVIITLNEERNIERCIKSVRDIADEIVVVDSYSTDRTEEICRANGARFVQHEFEDYVKQHVFADGVAANDYLLSIDADEVISEELNNSILEIKKHFKADAYTMNRKTNYCGYWVEHCGWYPDKKLRLYSKTAGQWSGIKIHESFQPKHKANIEHLKGDILHYSFPTLQDHYRQIENFSNIAAEAYFEQGIKAPLLKIIFSPLVRFIRDYFFLLGFLDGKYGLIICYLSARSVSMKYRKLKNLYKQASALKS
jgi:glycosyltransferase involved in cell wall biosynthesis